MYVLLVCIACMQIPRIGSGPDFSGELSGPLSAREGSLPFTGLHPGRRAKGKEDEGFLTISTLAVKKRTEHIN